MSSMRLPRPLRSALLVSLAAAAACRPALADTSALLQARVEVSQASPDEPAEPLFPPEPLDRAARSEQAAAAAAEEAAAMAFMWNATDDSEMSLVSSRMNRTGPTKQAMVNFADSQYVSYMTMGKQTIAGLLDTGSFELVVFGADCQTCGPAAHYNKQLSDTYEDGILYTSQNYGSGGSSCAEGWEKVSIGPYPPVKQMFWDVYQASMPVLQMSAFEAIIGVGPPDTPLAQVWSQTAGLVTELTGVYDQGLDAAAADVEQAKQMIDISLHLDKGVTMLRSWNVQEFGICMGAQPDSDGVFVWDDDAHLTKGHLFTRVPVTSKREWSAALTGVQLSPVNGGNATSLGCAAADKCEALIDSGTSLIAAPTKVLTALKQAMEDLDFNCSNLDILPDLEFDFDGHSFSLPPSAYVAKIEGTVPDYVAEKVPHVRKTSHQCALSLIDTGGMMGSTDLWILGMPWFRKYYTVFSLGQAPGNRAFYIAHHAEDKCEPAAPVTTRTKAAQKIRTLDANKLQLPKRRKSWMVTRDKQAVDNLLEANGTANGTLEVNGTSAMNESQAA